MSVNTYYTTDLSDASEIGHGRIAHLKKGNTFLPGGGEESSFYGECLIETRCEKSVCFSVETCVVKSARGFANDLNAAYRALEEWKKMGFRGSPASPASFVREMYKRKKNAGEIESKNCFSTGVALRRHFTGGWIEARKRGPIRGPLYKYDINSAYLSAALKGLPSKLRPYYPGVDCKGYVVAGRIKRCPKNAPNYLLDRYVRGQDALITSEEIARFGVEMENERGVCYDDLDVHIADVLYDLAGAVDYRIFKRCTQSFWGMFAGFSGVEVRRGEGLSGADTEWMLYNRFQNVAWASIIVRRVALEVFELMNKGGISCYVDSVLLPFEIETSTDTGGWKLESTYKKGIYLHAPGVYTELPVKNWDKSKWIKHAGFRRL